jgi:uncharacterized protein (TIGR00299 family) protein
MRIAFLQCFSGISGDMLLGALVDAGVDPTLLQRTAASLDIGAHLSIARADRSGISATKADVETHTAHDHEPQHSHAHAAEHHDHHQHGRSLPVILDLIHRAAIPTEAKQIATRAFELLGAAEARIHNVPVEQVHFHEVGAVDAIVDIVCAAVGCDALGVDEWICSPLNVGGGTVRCAHGTFPVPAPATLELLKDAPLYSSGIEAELVTPTGAALVRALGCRFERFPAMRVEKASYGAGTRNSEAWPNVLRLIIGTGTETAIHLGIPAEAQETVAVLETAVDDLSPQVVGYVTDRALARGALDVYTTPVQMKKNRPGTLLTVLCCPEDATDLRDLLFRETSTLGIRIRQEQREVLPRSIKNICTQWGAVRIKLAQHDGVITNIAPEYEDCRKIADKHDIPLKQVQQEVLRLFQQEQSRSNTAGSTSHD